MEEHSDQNIVNDTDYFGRILNERCSNKLRARVRECITSFRAFDKIGGPAMPYITAWQEVENKIWYEFVSKRFVDLLGCDADKVSEAFRAAVMDRHIYRPSSNDTEIQKEIFTSHELNTIRKKLREEGRKSGIVEAVYKVAIEDGKTIWLKDHATVEVFGTDGICLSLGSLMDVSKEMKAEDKLRQTKEDKEKLIAELQDALAKIKTLSGLLPICSNCKKIRDDKGYWNQIESFIRRHSEAEFSHSICPDCAKELYGEFYKGE